MTSRYAWRITVDHLSDGPDDPYSSVGVTGPSDAPNRYLQALDSGHGRHFRMYDDDGELYVEGKAYAEGDDVGSEDFCYGPLGDYGEGGLGCTSIRWTWHPEWNCG